MSTNAPPDVPKRSPDVPTRLEKFVSMKMFKNLLKKSTKRITNNAITDIKLKGHFLNSHDFSKIQIPFITPSKSIHKIDKSDVLTCNLEFSGFQKDHLDYISFITKIFLEKLDLKSSEIISKPLKIRKINTLVGSFVHSKTKEVFEEKIYTNSIQIYNSSNLDSIIKSLIQITPPGIDLSVENYYFFNLSDLKADFYKDIKGKQVQTVGHDFEDLVEKRMKEYLDKFK
jgi:ribosomal protein S10